jgi:hypothetical protein
MVKVVTLFKDVKDVEAFEKNYRDELLPFAFKIPGVIKVQITSLFQMTMDVSQESGGFQFMVEAFFESLEVLDFLLTSPEGIKMQELNISLLGGEMSIFMGKENKYYPPEDRL